MNGNGGMEEWSVVVMVSGWEEERWALSVSER